MSNTISSGDIVFSIVSTLTGYVVNLYRDAPSVSIDMSWSKLLCEHGTFLTKGMFGVLVGVRIVLCFCIELVFYHNIHVFAVHKVVMISLHICTFS